MNVHSCLEYPGQRLTLLPHIRPDVLVRLTLSADERKVHKIKVGNDLRLFTVRQRLFRGALFLIIPVVFVWQAAFFCSPLSRRKRFRLEYRIAKREVIRYWKEANRMGKKGKGKKAEVVFLVCEETGDRNYTLSPCKPGSEAGKYMFLEKWQPNLLRRMQMRISWIFL